MWVVVVQHEEDNHVTRVLGYYVEQSFALSAADQLRKEHRGFSASVHPVLARVPEGTVTLKARDDSGDAQ